MLTKEEMPACPVVTVVRMIGSKWRLLIMRNFLACLWRFSFPRPVLKRKDRLQCAGFGKGDREYEIFSYIGFTRWETGQRVFNDGRSEMDFSADFGAC